MTSPLGSSDIDVQGPGIGPADRMSSSEEKDAQQTTSPEEIDITIVADTTLTNDISLDDFHVSDSKKDVIRHIEATAGSYEHTEDDTQRGPRPIDPHSTNNLPESDFGGGDLTLDVTFVAEHGGDSLIEDRLGASSDKNILEGNNALLNGSNIPSLSSPTRSPHPRPVRELELTLKPPSPQPWETQTPTDFDPTKTTGLSIPVSATGYSPVASQKFSTMQAAAGNASRLVPKSSYYYGPPSSDAAYGTPPVGHIGVHHPREIIRIERDYTGGEIIQFAPIYPLELENRLTPTQFLESINGMNETLISAHSMRHAFLDNVVTVATLQLSRLFMSTHYQKEMKRLQHVIDDLNTMLFNPVGLNILWPGDVAFLYLEIEYY